MAIALDNTEYAVREVYSRNIANAEALVKRLYDATATSSLDFRDSGSGIFIVAVPDDAIADVVDQLTLPRDAILVHTSGSQPLEILSGSAARTGVFYPLQTFSKNRKVDFSEIPVFVESENAGTEKVLMAMARAISSKTMRISSQERRVMHIAAVFASNFTNHMLTLSEELMRSSKLDFDLLRPLIAETVNKALTLGPENSQTGPARRGDLRTLDQHMEYLRSDEGIAEIYRVVSQHIVDWYDT